MSQSDVDQWTAAGAQALQQTQAEQVRGSVAQALPVNPDAEAQLRRDASIAQVPLSAARELPAVVKQQAWLSTFDSDMLARKFPRTTQLLLDNDNANLLHDDIPRTASVEQAVRALPPNPVQDQPPSQASTLATALHYIFSTPGPGDTFMGDAGKLVLGGARALAGTAKYGALAASTLDRPVDAALGTDLQEKPLAVAHTLDEFAQGAPDKTASFKDQLLNVVGNTAGVLGEAMATGGEAPVARAGAKVMDALAPHIAHGVQAMMVPSSVAAQDTYNSVLEKTDDPVVATRAALTAYVTSTLGGVVPFATPGNLAVRAATGAVSGVGLGEVTHGATNLAMPDNMQAPARDASDRALDAVMGAMFGTLAGPKDLTAQLNAAARQSYVDATRNEAALRAGEALQQLGQVSALSKLRERDPEAFKAFVENVTEDGHLSEVYVDAKELTNALNQSGITPAELQSVMPDLQAQLHEASQTNADVRIPVADYATHIAGTDLDTAILPHLKADPDGNTYAQAQEAYKNQVDILKAAADKIVADHVDGDTLKQSMKAVEDDVLRQLREANRFADDVNTPYAQLWSQFFGVQAARLGVSPEDLYKQYAPKVTAPGMGGMEQGPNDPNILHQAALERATGDIGAKPTGMPVGGYYATDSQGRNLVRKDYKYGDMPPRFATPEAAVKAGAKMFVQPGKPLEQGERGSFNPDTNTISLLKAADLSTFLHESGHFFLEATSDMAAQIRDRAARVGAQDITPGERDIIRDTNALLKWFGVNSLEEWRAMSLDQQREHHENFARGFEAYLLGGKAPSVELQGMFQRFRTWLLNIYRSLSALKVDLTPEVRGVFDRMLASDDAIKTAEQVRGYRPLFESAADAGMTPEEFASYQQLGKDATADAVDELQARSLRDMKWLSNAKSKAIRELQREAAGKRREIKDQVTKEVDAAPAFAAKRFIDDAKKEAGPQPLEIDAKGRLVERKLPPPDMQIVADKFGFATADDMLRAIAERGDRKDIIEGMTDQRMLEQHGDLIDARSIERAAEEAIHNEARARFVAAELKALAKASGPARQMALAAKEAADASIAAKRVGELRPVQYTAAEARAARAAAKALAAGDLPAAASEKRAQLLNNRLAKAATEATEEVRRALVYLKKFDKASIRDKLPGEFVERIDQIKGALDLRLNPSDQNRKVEAILTWADGLRKLGYEPQIADWLAEARTPMSYKDATVEQFRGVVDAVRSIEHIARAQKEVTIAGKKVALEEVVTKLTARMEESGQKFTKEQLVERPSAKVDGMWAAATHWLAVHLRMVHNDLVPQEFKINKYDRHELAGPFRETLFDPILAGNYRKVDMLRRQSEAGRAVGDALGPDWQKSLYEAVKNDRLVDPDLSTPGNPVMLKMTRGRMLGVARQVGNESNFEKLTKGYGWNGADVWAFLHANMTAKDWQATQAHWDSFDPLWKESEAMIRRQGGVPPPKIPAREFDTPHGKMRGGYSPLDYDPLRSKLSVRMGEFDLAPGDKVGEQMLYRATTTHNSSMVARSEGYSDRVNLDFHSTDARIRDTIHDLAYREALLDVGKVVNDPKFRQKFLETYGREEYQSIADWLAGVRDMNTTDPRNRGFEKAMQYARQGVVLTGIGYRLSTVLKHGGAAALKSLGYLGNAEGAKYFAARVARMASGHMQEDLAQAQAKFSEIRARMLQMDRDFRVGNRSMYEAEGWKEKNDRFGHAMVAWSDALSATPTAWAAYDLAKTSGVPVSMGGTGKPMTEDAAVKYANSIVRQAHGTALEVTRSNFMQSRGAKGFFGALYGFMNNTYGQTADMLNKATSGGYFQNNPAVAARLMATLLVPALWTQWLKDGGPDDQKDPWYKWAGKAVAGEVGAMVPFVRDAVSLLEYGHGSQVAPSQMITDAVNATKDAWDEAHGKSTRLIQDLANTMGEWGHIAGLGQLGHILQYAREVAEGKKHPQSDAQAVKEAVIGGAPKN